MEKKNEGVHKTVSKSGDMDLLQQKIDRYSDMLYRIAFLQLRNSQDAGRYGVPPGTGTGKTCLSGNCPRMGKRERGAVWKTRCCKRSGAGKSWNRS